MKNFCLSWLRFEPCTDKAGFVKVIYENWVVAEIRDIQDVGCEKQLAVVSAALAAWMESKGKVPGGTRF